MTWREKLGTIGGIGLAIAIPISGGFGVSYAVNAMPLESSVEIPTSKDPSAHRPGENLGAALRGVEDKSH
ncbi:hypothetical protein ACL1HZ_09550 [Corynebacterium striatum]